MLLVVAHSTAARTTLRNAVTAHEETVVRRFGRAVLLEESGLGAFLACRLRAEHGTAVQVERTEPLVAERDVPADVRRAARAYADRESRPTPYTAFAAGTDHPDPETLRSREIDDG